MRTALTETTSKDINHEVMVEKEANIKMANAKKKWLIEYQAEREKKREYIRENVAAKGLDSSKLLAKLQKAKGTSFKFNNISVLKFLRHDHPKHR